MAGPHLSCRGLILALLALAAPAQASASSLEFSTLLGGRDGLDFGFDVATDGAGNTYVLSRTDSSRFPMTKGAFDTSVDGTDAVISKFDPSGSELIWSTALGGSGTECVPGCSLAVDAAGAVYVGGTTGSEGFPTTPGAFDTTHNGEFDAFVAKLDPGGGALVYSTFLGSPGGDNGFEIAVDAAGAAYVAGGASPGFPTTPAAFDTTHNGELDAFVAKLDPSGGALVYSTLLGGGALDRALDLDIDAAGAAFVAGDARSAEFPATPGAFDTTLEGASDGFAVKLNPGGDSLAYGTFVGGAAGDVAAGIAARDDGAAVVGGSTGSPDFPVTAGGFDQTFNGGFDAFVTTLDAAGSAIVDSTFLGGSQVDRENAVALGADGAIHVTGETTSQDYPATPGAFDTRFNGKVGFDVFAAKLAP
jgi:hypothetical protein